MRTPKGPVTTELPDWEELHSEYLDQQDRLGRLIEQTVARGENADWLRDELVDLQKRICAVNQMREITAEHRAA
ncbi:MAG: hypothetical protein AAF358_06670 [Pseudomonadota bacterium]